MNDMWNYELVEADTGLILNTVGDNCEVCDLSWTEIEEIVRRTGVSIRKLKADRPRGLMTVLLDGVSLDKEEEVSDVCELIVFQRQNPVTGSTFAGNVTIEHGA